MKSEPFDFLKQIEETPSVSGFEQPVARIVRKRMAKWADNIETDVHGNVIVMAGIPAIMQVMLDAATKFLKTGRKMLSSTIDMHRPEGEIAGLFGELQQRYPDVPMGSYPFYRDGKPGTQLVLRSTDAERLAQAENELKMALAARGWL